MARRLAFLTAALFFLAAAVASWNYFSVQKNAAQVLKDDPRNAGIVVYARYQWFLNPRVLHFELRSVATDKSALDVTRTLLQVSEKFKDREFDSVVLLYRGSPRFILKGDYFHRLGLEYESQNPMYTLRTLPENVYNLDGTPAFGTWSGGVLGVTARQMEDLNEFHKLWYLSSVAQGM